MSSSSRLSSAKRRLQEPDREVDGQEQHGGEDRHYYPEWLIDQFLIHATRVPKKRHAANSPSSPSSWRSMRLPARSLRRLLMS